MFFKYIYSLVMWRMFILIPSLLDVLLRKDARFVKGFFGIIWVNHVRFYCSIDVVWSVDVHGLNHLCISEIKLPWSWCTIISMCSQIWFVSVLLSMFASLLFLMANFQDRIHDRKTGEWLFTVTAGLVLSAQIPVSIVHGRQGKSREKFLPSLFSTFDWEEMSS